MWLITDWIKHSWELLQTRGWWFAVGLLLAVIVHELPLETGDNRNNPRVFRGLVWGVLLPVCNFAAISPAVILYSTGVGMGTVLAFLSAAVLLNPPGILSAWAYMGPKLAAAWIISAAAVSLAAGMAGARLLTSAEKKPREKLTRKQIFSAFLPELAFWLVLGILAQGLLQALFPKDFWQSLILNPAGAGFLDALGAGLSRHVCIPDDVALAASLAATGFPPGWSVLFLVVGICTNLPELFVLYGMAGKKTAVIYCLVTIGAGLAAAIVTQLLIGSGFVPQYSLAGAEPLIRIAGLLSISTWMPAKIPCAVILLLLAGWGLWIRKPKTM